MKISIVRLTYLLLCFFAALCMSEINAQSTSISSSNNKTTISIDNGKKSSFSLEYEGEFTISDDEKDITYISDGGYIEIRKSAFGSRRRIYMESDNAGGIVRKYYVGSKEKPYEGEGRKWLSEILPELLRTTTIGAEERVNRFYNNGGVDNVINEIEKIESDHVKTHYIDVLLDKQLTESELTATLKTVKGIGSDHHKANLLKDNLSRFLSGSNSMSSFLTVTKSINSDHHKANILTEVINDKTFSQDDMSTFFVIIDQINSDHHKANILSELMSSRKLDSHNLNLVISSTDGINSDHHVANVLTKALDSPNISQEGYDSLLKSIKKVNSDHHKANIFLNLLKKDLDEKSVMELLSISSNSINSEHHQANVLSQVLNRHNLKGTMLKNFLASTIELNSSHHVSNVYRRLADKKYSDSDLIMIINSVEDINSDHEMYNTLYNFSKQVSQASSKVKDAYRSAAKNLASESRYGKLLRAIED